MEHTECKFRNATNGLLSRKGEKNTEEKMRWLSVFATKQLQDNVQADRSDPGELLGIRSFILYVNTADHKQSWSTDHWIT